MTDAKLLLIFAVAALACFVLGSVLKKSRRRDERMLIQSQALPPMKGSLDASAHGRRVDVALGREILEMLEAGRRAEAVALLRERTGWGAEEAERMIVRLENLMKRMS
ncbi:MAG: hypothetical protein QOH51_1125 [Acidobacteriota bacterium]|jgi:hypothetical protein|nr:hypothetical protein [Acidobacteriota bacterium]